MPACGHATAAVRSPNLPGIRRMHGKRALQRQEGPRTTANHGSWRAVHRPLRARPRARAAAQRGRRAGRRSSRLHRLRPHAARRRARLPLRPRTGGLRAVPRRCGAPSRALGPRAPQRARPRRAPRIARRRRLTAGHRALAVDFAPPWIRSPSRSTIARPREEVFEYLADIANHAEFTDHYLVDWHLTREDSYGQGAGARFRVEAPLQPLPLGRRDVRRGRARRSGSSSPAAAASSTGSHARRLQLEPGPGGTTRVDASRSRREP